MHSPVQSYMVDLLFDLQGEGTNVRDLQLLEQAATDGCDSSVSGPDRYFSKSHGGEA